MMEFILSHVEKGVMTLTLNRPERLTVLMMRCTHNWQSA